MLTIKSLSVEAGFKSTHILKISKNIFQKFKKHRYGGVSQTKKVKIFQGC